MGEVWQVEDTLCGGDVPAEQALKVLRGRAGRGAGGRGSGRDRRFADVAAAGFASEFRILAGLRTEVH